MSTIDKLLAQAQTGDKSAENDLFQYLSVRFRLIAKRRIGEEAEDLAQEACLTVLEKYKDETFTKGFEPWAYGVLRMKIGNYLQGPRRKKRLETDIDDRLPASKSGSEVDPVLKREVLSCLMKIFKRNKNYASVLNMTYQGYSTEEICRRLSIKANNMYVMLNRSRNMLRICLSSGTV